MSLCDRRVPILFFNFWSLDPASFRQRMVHSPSDPTKNASNDHNMVKGGIKIYPDSAQQVAGYQNVAKGIYAKASPPNVLIGGQFWSRLW